MRTLKLAVVVSILAACAVAQPVVGQGGVVNAASFAGGQAVAPGSEVAIFGSSLAANTVPASSVPLSFSLGNTSVTFNGIPAALYVVSDGQVNAQMPWNVLPANQIPGSVNVVVTKGGVASAPIAVSIGAAAPGIYSIPPGAGYAVAINPDSSLAAPVGVIPGATTHPAKAGDTLIVLATGLGAVNPTVANGAGPTVTTFAVVSPTATIGGKSAQVAFAGLAPGFPGINQLNIVVPAGVTGNSLAIQLSDNGVTSTDQVVIAVQ
ncbi:MAG TPA: IPT/TIG domain-containing protein [Bryobacteraceae bacterium]|jgi:uncharacterized protein (TIGR03437 family)